MVARDWILDGGIEGFVGDLSINGLCRLGDALVAESGITVFTRSGREVDFSAKSESEPEPASYKEQPSASNFSNPSLAFCPINFGTFLTTTGVPNGFDPRHGGDCDCDCNFDCDSP